MKWDHKDKVQLMSSDKVEKSPVPCPNCSLCQIVLKNFIYHLLWMAITVTVLILPFPALPNSYKSRPYLRRLFLKKRTQIPSSIA